MLVAREFDGQKLETTPQEPDKIGEDHDRSRVCLVFTNCSHDLVINRQLPDSKMSTNSNHDTSVRVIGIVNHGLAEGIHG
jgi:hypothetical protein